MDFWDKYPVLPWARHVARVKGRRLPAESPAFEAWCERVLEAGLPPDEAYKPNGHLKEAWRRAERRGEQLPWATATTAPRAPAPPIEPDAPAAKPKAKWRGPPRKESRAEVRTRSARMSKHADWRGWRALGDLTWEMRTQFRRPSWDDAEARASGL